MPQTTDVPNYEGRIELVAVVPAPGSALTVSDKNFTPKGYQQFDNTTLAASTALTVPSGATIAIVQNNHTQPMRWRDDGVAPTGTTGLRIAADTTAPLVYQGNLSALRLIKQADGTGTVDVWYGA